MEARCHTSKHDGVCITVKKRTKILFYSQEYETLFEGIEGVSQAVPIIKSVYGNGKSGNSAIFEIINAIIGLVNLLFGIFNKPISLFKDKIN